MYTGSARTSQGDTSVSADRAIWVRIALRISTNASLPPVRIRESAWTRPTAIAVSVLFLSLALAVNQFYLAVKGNIIDFQIPH